MVYYGIPDMENNLTISRQQNGRKGLILTDRLMEILAQRIALQEEIQALTEEQRRIEAELAVMDFRHRSVLTRSGVWLEEGRRQFNNSCKKGMKFLTCNKVVPNNPADIAKFLLCTQGLSKLKIGEYLGEGDSFNVEVLKHYARQFHFSGRSIVSALRQFLDSFLLPGEAQKIDRMMEQFSESYFLSNPDTFTSTDACYRLAYSIIMLNTSLHNPNIRDKDRITLDRFMRMNEGSLIDTGTHLLTEIYEDIRTNPFKPPDDLATSTEVQWDVAVQAGFLWKEGLSTQRWEKFYCILKDNCLFCFKNKGDRLPVCIIPLENLKVKDDSEGKSKNCFKITHSSTSIIRSFEVDWDLSYEMGKSLVYRFEAGSLKERDEWITNLRKNMVRERLFDYTQWKQGMS